MSRPRGPPPLRFSRAAAWPVATRGSRISGGAETWTPTTGGARGAVSDVSRSRRGRCRDGYGVWGEQSGCPCAAKAARPDSRTHQPARRRVRAEGRPLLSLAHPHIVRPYELIERPAPVLILETIDGESVYHLVH